VNDVNVLECPNCGSTDLVEIKRNKHRCTYCATVLTEKNQAVVVPSAKKKCPRCGFANERGDRYCNDCGKPLVRIATSIGKSKKTGISPANLSILVSIVGSLFIPFGGPVLGLILGYKALGDARNGEQGEKSERQAKTAIAIGWAIVAFSLVMMCIAMGMPTVQSGCSMCQSLFDELFNALHLDTF